MFSRLYGVAGGGELYSIVLCSIVVRRRNEECKRVAFWQTMDMEVSNRLFPIFEANDGSAWITAQKIVGCVEICVRNAYLAVTK